MMAGYKKIKLDLSKPLSLFEQKLLGILLEKFNKERGFFEKEREYNFFFHNQKFSINISHDIFRRPRRRKPEQFRYEVMGEKIGGGGEGDVVTILSTIALRKNGLPLFKRYKDRAVKISVMLDNYMKGVNISKEVKHLHTKAPFQFGKFGMMVMRFITGKNLSSFYSLSSLTTDERYKLTLNLLRSVQVTHGQHIIHNDLKCENILIDNELHVFLIDFDMARKKEDLKGKRYANGTVGYMAPERFKLGGTSEKSDLYALGIIIGELWGIDSPQANSNDANYDALRFNKRSFSQFDLSSGEKGILKGLLSDMTTKVFSERNITITNAINIIEGLQLERKLEKITDPYIKKQVSLANLAAKKARAELKNFSNHENKSKEIILQYLQEFDEGYNEAIEEFFKILNVDCLSSVKTKAEFIQKMDWMENMLIDHEAYLKDMHAELSSVVNNKEFSEGDQLDADIQLEELEELLEKFDTPTQSIDDKFELAKRIQTGFARFEWKKLALDVASKEFPSLKKYMSYLVAKYLYEHQKYPPFSKPSHHNVGEIIQNYKKFPNKFKISKNNNHAIQLMIQAVESSKTSNELLTRIEEASWVADRGFFNRSRLVDYVESAIKSFTQTVEEDLNARINVMDQKNPSP